MNDQAKIERTIKLLLLLSGSFGYAIDEISKKFDISKRNKKSQIYFRQFCVQLYGNWQICIRTDG
jgi:hypothetical protein